MNKLAIPVLSGVTSSFRFQSTGMAFDNLDLPKMFRSVSPISNLPFYMLCHSPLATQVNPSELTTAKLTDEVFKHENYLTDLGQNPQDGKFMVGCTVFRGSDYISNEISEGVLSTI